MFAETKSPSNTGAKPFKAKRRRVTKWQKEPLRSTLVKAIREVRLERRSLQRVAETRGKLPNGRWVLPERTLRRYVDVSKDDERQDSGFYFRLQPDEPGVSLGLRRYKKDLSLHRKRKAVQSAGGAARKARVAPAPVVTAFPPTPEPASLLDMSQFIETCLSPVALSPGAFVGSMPVILGREDGKDLSTLLDQFDREFDEFSAGRSFPTPRNSPVNSPRHTSVDSATPPCPDGRLSPFMSLPPFPAPNSPTTPMESPRLAPEESPRFGNRGWSSAFDEDWANSVADNLGVWEAQQQAEAFAAFGI